MVQIYGLKNCDTTQKAIKWLRSRDVAFTFHDFREEPPAAGQINKWLQHVPLARLLNKQSTTYRSLPEQEQQLAGTAETAVGLMVSYPALIKRPLAVFAHGAVLAGWKEDAYIEALQ